MASKKSLLGKVFAFSLFAAFSMSANAQIKYNSSGRLTIGTTTPYSFYPTTHNGSIYFKDNSSHFFQIDITPANPRLAGQGDQVVFYTHKRVRLTVFKSRMSIITQMLELKRTFSH